MTKLSDHKFIARSLERSTPKKIERPDPADLAALRGVAEKARREAQHLVPGLDGSYEPVSFAHPHNGRRIYGWLVAVDSDGNARVEIGDGEYACVPPHELRRLGAREDRAKIQAELRRSIGQVSMETNGVRADLYETTSMVPLSGDDTLQLLSLGYSTSFGMPTGDELAAFVDRFHPTACIVEVDANMPGRVGLALQFDAAAHEAEMGAAHGGEVQEVLDPAEVSEEAEHKQGASKQAIWPFGGRNKAAPTTPQTSSQDLVNALTESQNSEMAEKVIKTYIDNGGARFLSSLDRSFNRETLFAAALPVIQRMNPSLYREIAKASVAAPQAAPPQPQAPSQPQGVQSPEGVNVGKADPFADVQQEQEDAKFQQQFQQYMNASKRSALFERKTADKLSDSAGSPTIESAPSPTEPKPNFTRMTQHGLPPSMTDIFNTMKMHRFARRGDYVMARVEWDPAALKGRTANAVKNMVMTFVKAKAGSTRQGANFGVIGKVYVLSLDEKKGQAEVQFASENAGPAPMAVVTE